jgi:hypothetical protein
MPCLFVIVALAFPRLALILLFLFTNYLERAYHDFVIPLIGFIFLPLTTLAYAWIVNAHHPLAGLYLVLFIVAILADLGLLGGGAYSRRRA